MIRACKDCPDRVAEPNCHMTCEKYLAEKEKDEAIREARRKNLAQNVEVFAYSNCKAGRKRW